MIDQKFFDDMPEFDDEEERLRLVNKRNLEKLVEIDPMHQKFAKLMDKIPTADDLKKMFQDI